MTDSNVIRDDRLVKTARYYNRATDQESWKEGIEKIIAFARANNYQIDPLSYGELSNNTNAQYQEREVLMTILEDAEQGTVKTLLVLSLDRIGRNAAELQKFIEALNERGCDVVVCE